MVNATTRWPYIKCTDTVTHLTTNNACVALQLNVNGAKVLTKLFRCVETGLFNSGLKSGMKKWRIRMFNEKYINQCPRAWHRGQMKCSWISSFTLSGDIGSTISMFISFLFSLSFCSLSAPLWISLSFSCFYELSPLFLYAHSIPYPTLDYSFIFILSFTKKISFFSVLSVLFALPLFLWLHSIVSNNLSHERDTSPQAFCMFSCLSLSLNDAFCAWCSRCENQHKQEILILLCSPLCYH